MEQHHGGSAAGLYALGSAALLAALMLACMPKGWRKVAATPVRSAARPDAALSAMAQRRV